MTHSPTDRLDQAESGLLVGGSRLWRHRLTLQALAMTWADDPAPNRWASSFTVSSRSEQLTWIDKLRSRQLFDADAFLCREAFFRMALTDKHRHDWPNWIRALW